MDKTLENTLKVEINNKLLTCDDKEVLTDDGVVYRKQNHPTVDRRFVGEQSRTEIPLSFFILMKIITPTPLPLLPSPLLTFSLSVIINTL